MFQENFDLLKQEASRMGYKTNIVSNRFVSSCGHLTKIINISKQSGDIESIFEFAHELGHCKQFTRRWRRLEWNKEMAKNYYRKRDKSKIRFMIDEIEAWILGYSILKRNKINTKRYINHSISCLYSHLVKTKPNSVK